jgi:outer membrane lipoprotein
MTSLSQKWIISAAVCLAALSGSACSGVIPGKYVKQAEPGVTLTALTAKPEQYRGKTVILGGVILEAKEQDGRMWLLMRNRPVDADYEPHRDMTLRPSESGHYWVILDPRNLPATYRKWARVTVVGRVSDQRPIRHADTSGTEPVLAGLYLHGWGAGGGGGEGWESRMDANYIQSNPLGELRQ